MRHMQIADLQTCRLQTCRLLWSVSPSLILCERRQFSDLRVNFLLIKISQSGLLFMYALLIVITIPIRATRVHGACFQGSLSKAFPGTGG